MGVLQQPMNTGHMTTGVKAVKEPDKLLCKDNLKQGREVTTVTVSRHLFLHVAINSDQH